MDKFDSTAVHCSQARDYDGVSLLLPLEEHSCCGAVLSSATCISGPSRAATDQLKRGYSHLTFQVVSRRVDYSVRKRTVVSFWLEIRLGNAASSDLDAVFKAGI